MGRGVAYVGLRMCADACFLLSPYDESSLLAIYLPPTFHLTLHDLSERPIIVRANRDAHFAILPFIRKTRRLPRRLQLYRWLLLAFL